MIFGDLVGILEGLFLRLSVVPLLEPLHKNIQHISEILLCFNYKV